MGLSPNRGDREHFQFGFANKQTHGSVSDTGFILKAAFNFIVEKLVGSASFDNVSSNFVESDSGGTETLIFKSGATVLKTVTVVVTGYGQYSITVAGVEFLLQENGDNLLLENGSSIIL